MVTTFSIARALNRLACSSCQVTILSPLFEPLPEPLLNLLTGPRQARESRFSDAPGRHGVGDFQAQLDVHSRVIAQNGPGLVEMQQHDVAFAINAEVFESGDA